MKDYISDQNREVIESAIHTLKEELDFDAGAISQLHFAIYLFQESVSVYLFLLLMIFCVLKSDGGGSNIIINLNWAPQCKQLLSVIIFS
jgi:hypothetical protein